MEWKKEKMSAAELERKQKEYMNEALAMMKRGTSHTERAEPAESAEREPAAEEAPQKLVMPEDEQREPAPAPETDGTEAPEDDSGSDDEVKFGVYTADEIMSGDYNDDGLKKAAVILEEMTRNTEMMRKIAAGGDDGSDTTDFPEFSSDCSESGEGERFREQENVGTPQEETDE